MAPRGELAPGERRRARATRQGGRERRTSSDRAYVEPSRADGRSAYLVSSTRALMPRHIAATTLTRSLSPPSEPTVTAAQAAADGRRDHVPGAGAHGAAIPTKDWR